MIIFEFFSSFSEGEIWNKITQQKHKNTLTSLRLLTFPGPYTRADWIFPDTKYRECKEHKGIVKRCLKFLTLPFASSTWFKSSSTFFSFASTCTFSSWNFCFCISSSSSLLRKCWFLSNQYSRYVNELILCYVMLCSYAMPMLKLNLTSVTSCKCM